MTNEQRVLLPLADGFEEIEAITIIDVLRRAGVVVRVAGLTGATIARGAHGVGIEVDCNIDDVDLDSIEAVVLAGGLPGATSLRDDKRVIAALQYMAERGRWIAAICAAPIALTAAGILADESVRATSYPAFRDQLGNAEVVNDEPVVISGRIITSAGPGTALDFSLTLAAVLVGPELASEIASAMLTEMSLDAALHTNR
ncbi:MAG: DJ-1/PfpI family protein [Planctomycetota bacterium]|nr:DJ-1/PfpI family protein [Planctomycetota bacterium]